jgi:hypothetical protein
LEASIALKKYESEGDITIMFTNGILVLSTQPSMIIEISFPLQYE